MSQFPVDTDSNLVEAVNYLLSGPTSIGQNFEGVSAVADPANDIVTTFQYDMFTNAMAAPFTTNATVTGSNITPTYNNSWPQLSSIDFYQTTPPGITTPNVVINNITSVTNNIIDVDATINPIYITAPLTTNTEFIFTEPGPYPFVINQKLTISGVTPSVYNGNYRFVEDTGTAYRLLRIDGAQTWTAYTSGGQISWQQQNIVTDLFAPVSINGPTDRVFITCQAPFKGYINNPTYTGLDVGFDAPTYELRINRYKATNATTLPNGAQAFPYVYNGYEWALDGNLVTVPYTLFADPLTMTDGYTYFKPDISTFNNVIDSPGIGYFLYTFEIYFNNQYYDPNNPTTSPNIQPIAIAYYGFRSFTAQVIKR
jgi:hypothetical protein